MKILTKPTWTDFFILSAFVVLITFHPYYAHKEINFFETGLYLPGIQSVLNGEVPFRDFFHLRGPFEGYMPAILMKLFGVHIKWLFVYFYAGTVLCLIFTVLVAKEVLQTRFIFYLFVPVLVARTFTRVVFTYWGGMRYALGMLALWFIIKFFKTDRKSWLFGAGIVSAAALLTSVEMGIYLLLGVLSALTVTGFLRIQPVHSILESVVSFLAGMLLVIGPYFIYLVSQQALAAYLDSVFTIVTRMQEVIDPHFVSIYPRNPFEALLAMFNPLHTNFKHMTPSYVFLAVVGYLIYRIRNRILSKLDLFILCLGVYGFVMYNTGFRGIWAAQFEMALQPEKILLFFLLELVLLDLARFKDDRGTPVTPLSVARRDGWSQNKALFFYLFVFIVFFSSVGYSIARYNHRFFAFQYFFQKLAGKSVEDLKPWNKIPAKELHFERARGLMIPVEQADELNALDLFTQSNIKEGDAVLTYPDFGTYNFLFDWDFAGRFPMATFAWFKESWQTEFMTQLNNAPPEYVVLEKNIPQGWKDVYLAREPNRKKFQTMMDFIQARYDIVQETPQSLIMKVKRN